MLISIGVDLLWLFVYSPLRPIAFDTLLALSRGDFEQLLGPLKEALDETFIVRALANIAILAKLSDADGGRGGRSRPLWRSA